MLGCLLFDYFNKDYQYIWIQILSVVIGFVLFTISIYMANKVKHISKSERTK